ncbi:hypothetical protein E1A91_D07G245500v1 [Gossypium mustelinum]|uniref:Cytochrome P450 n=1 Tax=Gossypium mustelinum TaxID=34275 RepID=A0A5D2UET5_GOSMU|nr:hypothetical protein E1A91_D07G245500v1 [Gossypium mustelinum]
MMFTQLFASLLLFALPFLFLTIIRRTSKSQKSASSPSNIPKSYPIIGSYFAIKSNQENRVQWTTEILQSSLSATFTLHNLFGSRQIFTSNPANVQHMLKTHFFNYHKGPFSRGILFDFLGHGIFNVNGESWKFQRQVSSHEFNTKSLRKFVQTVVDTELHDRLIPMLSDAVVDKSVLDLQDILQRFAFDNVCKIAFGFDPASFEDATDMTSERFRAFLSIAWKIKRFFNVGSEKRLHTAVTQVRDFARKIVREKKQELADNSSLESVDLLSRFLTSGHTDENFATDIVISFILAGRDTTSAALTWFFWLLHKNPEVEKEILKEIKGKSGMPVFEEVKDMVYTHAALCECMRLYPPVPLDSKTAVDDDILPDGTVVKKGTVVTYHPYEMGRMEITQCSQNSSLQVFVPFNNPCLARVCKDFSPAWPKRICHSCVASASFLVLEIAAAVVPTTEKIWGSDWAEFKPERWLQRDEAGKWIFVGRDPYTYPVFQAGPRICLGKEMAFLQMKRMVSGVLRQFKVVPAVEDGFQPSLVVYLTSKMKGGFPVRMVEREDLD